MKSVENSDPEKSISVMIVNETSSKIKSSTDCLLEIVSKSVAGTNACFLKQGTKLKYFEANMHQLT